LMRYPYGVLKDAPPEDLRCNSLLFGKPAIASIDQDVRVNEGGHAYTDPLASSLGPAAASL
jgi:hypothetical protein